MNQKKYKALCMICGFKFSFKAHLKGNEIFTCPRCQENVTISRDFNFKKENK